MERLQDRVVAELADHTAARHPGDRNRFPRLLLLLSPLRSLHADTLEDLFFSGLIGNIQIDSVIPYILKMEPREYQNHLGAMRPEQVKVESSSTSEAPVEVEEQVEVDSLPTTSSEPLVVEDSKQ